MASAKIGHFDGEIKEYGFRSGETIQNLLGKAGLTLSSGEEVNDENGNPVRLTEPIENGAEYFVTASYKNGN